MKCTSDHTIFHLLYSQQNYKRINFCTFYGAETMWVGSLGPRMSWGTRAANFSIHTTKMERAGLQILGTGAKFKRVPCQKSCRVNRA